MGSQILVILPSIHIRQFNQLQHFSWCFFGQTEVLEISRERIGLLPTEGGRGLWEDQIHNNATFLADEEFWMIFDRTKSILSITSEITPELFPQSICVLFWDRNCDNRRGERNRRFLPIVFWSKKCHPIFGRPE
jgi:hypothetical protein